MAGKIIGLKKAVTEFRNCPPGFHVEIWGGMDEHGDVLIWTSEYLSQNSWTINHADGEHRLDNIAMEVMAESETNCSMTAALKGAVSAVFGVDA